VIEAKSSVTKLVGRTPQDPQVGLADQVMAAERGMWPTPIAADAYAAGSRNLPGSKAHAGVSLTDAVRYGNSSTPRREPEMWPTPTANNYETSPEVFLPRREREKAKGRNGNGFGLTLGMAAQLWPTPAARDWRSGKASAATMARNARPLNEEVVARMWPTPKASPSGPDYARMNREDSGGDDLATAVAKSERWPTPTAHDRRTRAGQASRYLDPARSYDLNDAVAARTWPTPTKSMHDIDTMERARFSRDHIRSLKEQGTPYQTQTSGSLNPTWVEWLMGFPLGWTDLGDSATPSSRRSRTGSATRSSRRKQPDIDSSTSTASSDTPRPRRLRRPVVQPRRRLRRPVRL
jgi:hypothetical protein